MPSDDEQRPPGKPEYRVYRSRRGLFSRFRKPDLESLREKSRPKQSSAGGKGRGEREKPPYEVHRQGRAPVPRTDREMARERAANRPPRWKRWFKWIAIAACGWLLLSLLAFSVVAETL